MNKTTIRFISTITALTTLFTIAAGCKKDGNGNSEAGNPSGNVNIVIEDETSEYAYVSQNLALPDGVSDIQNVVYLDGKLYFVSNHYDYDEESFRSTYFSKICEMNADGTGFAELTDYAPPAEIAPGASGGTQIMQMAADADGNLCVLERWEFSLYDFSPGSYDAIDLDSGAAIRKLSRNGAELSSVDIGVLPYSQGQDNELPSEPLWFNITGFNYDVNENLYVFTAWSDKMGLFTLGEIIYVIDSGGGMKHKVAPNSPVSERLIRMPDGSVAYMSFDASGDNENVRALVEVGFNEEDFSIAAAIPADGRRLNAHPGSGDYDILISDENALYGIKTSDGEAVKLLGWSDSNIDAHNANIESVAILPDGSIICNVRSYDRTTGNAMSELLVLTKRPIAEVPDITVLTLATYAFAYDMKRDLRDMVVRFNSTNRDYQIEVIDYHDYDVVSGDFAGITRLNTEIIAGNIPDIIDLQVLPYARYASAGLLEDLYPFLESDPSLGRGDLMEGALRAAEIDGKLYQLFPKFAISTIAGNPSVLGSDTSWSLGELKAVINAHPNADAPLGLGWPSEKTMFLQLVIEHNIHEYVDWNSGTANFDTESFAALLEFVDTLSDEAAGYDDFTPNLFAVGRQLMEVMQFSTFWEYQSKKAQFGGDIVFKGFPSYNKSGSSSLSANGLAITTASTNKEGAWQFLRTMLDVDYQLSVSFYSGFPTNKVAFDEVAAQWMDESSGVFPTDFATGKPLFGSIAKEDVDKILELIDSLSVTTGLTVLDNTFWNIIFEGAEDYFSGVRSAEDAARIIQNRASTYVSERS